MAAQASGLDILYYGAAAAIVAYLLWKALTEFSPKTIPYD